MDVTRIAEARTFQEKKERLIEQVIADINCAGLREGTIRPFKREGYNQQLFNDLGGLEITPTRRIHLSVIRS